MLALNVIEFAQALWALLVIFVTMKKGVLRFCAGFRKLNAVAVHRTYSLPRQDKCIDSLQASQVFSTLYASSNY